jgi:hypothetical protein
MKLWFEGCDVNAPAEERPLRPASGGQTVRPNMFAKPKFAKPKPLKS